MDTKISYSNSVIQALYYCKPFRECITNYPFPATLPSTTVPSSLQSPGLTGPSSPVVGTSSYFASSSTSSSINNNNNSNNNNRPANSINGLAAASQPSFQPPRTSISSRTPATNANTNSNNALANVISSSHHERDHNGDLHLSPGMEDTLFAALKDLFWKIATHRKKTGVVAPVNFINKVKKENGN